MNEFTRRIRYLLNCRRFDRELANDMAFHREMMARDTGIPFGSDLRLREEAREVWGWTWIENLSQDLRYATRQLRKSPLFTSAAVLMLAIGIGANVAAFGFFNLMVLRPLPVCDPNTLLRFKRHAPQSYAYQLPYPEMAFVSEHTKTLSAVLALTSAKLTVDGESHPLNASFVTANYFSELGATATIGRMFDPVRDGAPDAEPVAVLSDGFWRSHFGANASAVGQIIRFNDKPATVIGIAPAAFGGLSLDNPNVWLPINQHPYFVTGSRLLIDFAAPGSGVTMFGRLQPGLSSAAAENELQSLLAQLRQQYPADIWQNERLVSAPGGYAKNLGGSRSGTGAEARNDTYPLAALAAALVLLILAVACSNLGSLLLARGVSRQREMSIRSSIGAGSGRLIRQLFTESLLLALLGSFAGLALGYGLLRFLMVIAKAPGWLHPSLDWRVTSFGIAAGFGAAILFGLTPALQVARRRRPSVRTRQVLIGAQVAASCILVVVSALLVRSLQHVVSTRPGFEYQQVVSVDPGLAAHGYSPARARLYLNTLQNRLRNLPGIESVSMTSSTPLGNRKVVTGADVDGRSVDVHMYGIDPDFFRTMKIPILQGRNLTNKDAHAILISKSFAQQWSDGNPIGKPFQMGASAYTVIGIAGSARLVALQDPDAVEAYYLAGDSDLPSMTVILRALGPPEGLVGFVQSLAKSVDPKVFPEVQLMKSSFRRRIEGTESVVLSVSALGGTALLLACFGVVGLVSYSVSQRTKEIGVRMALGAKPVHVISGMIDQLTSPVIVGLLIGLGGAAGLSKLLRRELYGISNLDPVAYVGAIGLFAIAVILAALLPARRALAVDPLQSLRHE